VGGPQQKAIEELMAAATCKGKVQVRMHGPVDLFLPSCLYLLAASDLWDLHMARVA